MFTHAIVYNNSDTMHVWNDLPVLDLYSHVAHAKSLFHQLFVLIPLFLSYLLVSR